MGTTLGKKEEVKTSVRTKKVMPIKRAVKKITTKKVAEPKAKVASKKPVKKVTTRTRKGPSVTVDNPEVVFVPTTASLRLLEKVQLYTVWYERTVPGAMSTVAKVGGYAFILLGTVFAVSSYIDAKNILSNPAALICSDSECTTVADEDLPVTAPKISFLNSIPSTLSADTDFKINLVNVTKLSVSLTAVETGATIILEPTEQLTDSEYRFLIPGSRLAPGTYVVKASTDTDGTMYTFTGPDFKVVEKLLPTPAPTPIVTEVIEEMVLTQPLGDTEEGTATTSEAVGQNAEEVLQTEESPEATEEDIATTTSRNDAPIVITLNSTNNAEYLTVLTGDFTPSKVAVYSKLSSVGQPLYLGQAMLVQGEWFFSVSALQLPVTDHYLYASFVVNGKTYQSEAVRYVPDASAATSPATEADLAILVQKIELALLASSISNENRRRYFDYFASQPESLFALSDEVQFAEPNLIQVIDTAMRNDSESLQPLLLRYAAAVQGESDFLISLTNKALTEHYIRLASSIAATIGQPEVVPSIHTVLALRYQVLKDRIRESEDLIKQETNGLTARDSDQDGISDFDEVANFGTSPLFADTDGDGVIDSVELVRGSDSLTADLKIIPELNKNIEEVTFGELVEINYIAPQVSEAKTAENSDYQVMIQGRSVPNSYVFILSYTTGVVGIVKTSSSGSFSYTIERDFAVGEHEIAAVVTDAAGNIVASSKTHRFARTENSFVASIAMSAQAGQVIQPSEDTVLLHILVAAVGVITFGFILLLFSNTLRNRRPQKTSLAS